MTVHEVVYFNGAGRAEATRICLFIASQRDSVIDFKDTRIEFHDWPEMKPKTPLGSLPLLKIDGATHIQSIAMARYAAKLAGLYPTDPIQELYVDEVMDTLNDLISAMPQSKDEEEKKKLREEFATTKMKQFCDFIERIVQTNGKGKSVATSPSVADILLKVSVAMVSSGLMDYVNTNYFDSYPGIVAAAEAIGNDDGVKAYYASLEK